MRPSGQIEVKGQKSILMVFVFLCLPVLSFGQYNKKHDSLLNIYRTMPEDTAKVSMLGALHFSVLFSDIELSKKYAEEQLALAKKLNYTREEADAYRNLASCARSVGDKDLSIAYTLKCKELSEKINWTWGIIDADRKLAILYDESGKDDLAIEITLKNIEERKKINDTRGIAGDLKLLAGIYGDKKQNQLAYKYCFEALKLYKDLNDSLGLGDTYYQLSILESQQGNSARSIENGLRALRIYENQNDLHYQALTHNLLGSEYYVLEDYELAEKTLQKGLVLAREAQNPIAEEFILSSLGNTKIKLGDPEEGIELLESALKLSRENLRPDGEVAVLSSLAEVRLEQERLNEALSNINTAIIICDTIAAASSKANALKIRSQLYKRMRQPILALKDYEAHYKIKDSLYAIEKSSQVQELRILHDTEEKEQQITRQKTEIALLEEKEKVSSLQKWLLGSGLGLSLLVFGFGFYGIRQKMKRNKLEKEKVDAELAFKKKELTTYALHLAKKNEVLEQVKQQASELKSVGNVEKGYQALVQTINLDQQDDKAWDNFTQYFEAVHKDFSKRILTLYPNITKNELRLMALIKMNLSSKEIASILNISSDGIKKARQRLRKKMNLPPEDSLETTVMAI